ncbi:unnamed protein product [marine sediment metagenome]|uniref:Uncharacterized protein n=1 Tax=marine sediment metagenome TaxID=412755 RepID=X1UNN8_9ZZZZ
MYMLPFAVLLVLLGEYVTMYLQSIYIPDCTYNQLRERALVTVLCLSVQT